MTDGELYSSASTLSCEPEPLSSSIDEPMMSVMPVSSSATPSYLSTPAPSSATAATAPRRRGSGASASSRRRPATAPAAPADPAAARRRYRSGATWGPPPEPNMSIMPPSTTTGLECDPSTMSCPAPDGSELTTPAGGATGDGTGSGGGASSGGGGPTGPEGANGEGEGEAGHERGPSRAQERERKFQEKQEDMELAIPFTPLKVPEADTTDKRLYPLYIQAPTAGPNWSAPGKLEVEPTGDKRKIPAAYAGYEQQFSDAAGTAKSLYDTIIAEGRAQTVQAAQLLEEIKSDAQSSLDRNNALLDMRLAEERKRLGQSESEAISRLELIADTSRLLVRLAASRVLGTLAARKAVIRARMVDAESEIANIEYRLVGYQAEIARTGAAASAAFTQLATDPAPARVQPNEGSGSRGEPELTNAVNESPPMDQVITRRSTNREQAFLNGVRVFGAQMSRAVTAFESGKDNALGPFKAYETMLGTTAPQQVRKMRTDAIKTIDRMEKRARRTIQESRNSADIALVEKHKAARTAGLAQAQATMAGQARGLERGAIGQWRSYAGLASAQAQAILALKRQIAEQRSQPPEAFARFADQAARRTATTAERMSAQRLAMLSTTALRTRGTFAMRASQANTVQENATEKQAAQLQTQAQQAAIAMLRTMLSQESTMRQSAEPIAKSVDSYTIPATAELDAMEVALWNALGLAQQQANQAYFGGGPPGEGGASENEGPPPGTGELPYQFVDLATAMSANPDREEQLVALKTHIAREVRSKVETSENNVRGQMNWSNDPVATLQALHGLTPLQGRAVDSIYQSGGRPSLFEDGPWYLNVGNMTMAVSTYRYYVSAFRNYLRGNRAAGALAEVQAAANYSNNDEQAQAAMMALSPADMSALRDLPGSGAILDGVARDLGGNQETAFNILREVNATNATERVAAARAVLLTGTITDKLNSGSDSGADAASDSLAGLDSQIGSTRIEKGDVYAQYGLVLGPEMRTGADAVSRASDPAPLPDDFRFESSAESTARHREGWNLTIARLGTDGTIPTDGRLSGVDWLRDMASRRRTRTESDGEGGSYEVDITIRQEQVSLLVDMARLGPDHPRVRARRMIVEETRAGGPNGTRVATALQDDAGNAGLFNPEEDVTDPNVMRRRREQLAAASQREADMYHFYDCFRTGHEDDAYINNPANRRPTIEIKRELGGRLSTAAGGGSAGELLRRQVVEGLTSPSAAALAFHRAVDGAGTNEQLLKDTFGRLSPEQAREAVQYYDDHYGPPGLYERLGIFGEGGFFTELSGDDAIDIQVLAMGRARNDVERLERSRMTSTLHRAARDKWYSVGSLFAGDESRRMDESHAAIMNLAGVSDASFDRFGRLQRRDGRYMGRWNSDGSFAPVARDSAANSSPGAIYDSLAFAAALTSNERNVEAYKVAVDNIAGMITTAIIVVTAIVTTAVTFGGAASIWIPMGIAAAGGLAAMAVNATLKGGRYGYEDAFRDLGMTIVQTATAGLGASLSIAAVGGKAALAAAMTSRMIALGTRAPSFAAQLGIGVATGAFAGAGNALFDDAAWDRGDWLSGIGHGFLRGGISGGAAAGVTAGLTAGISRVGSAVAGGVGRATGFGSALARGASVPARGRLASMIGGRYATAASNSFALSQLSRTVGGGFGGAVSRYVEIEYDRGRGRYAGTRAQAWDEIVNAGVQNAVQSYGEGVGEHAAMNSGSAQNWQRRNTGAVVVSDADGSPITVRRPPANDNSDPQTQQLWREYDRPRSTRSPPDADTRASMAAEHILEARARAQRTVAVEGDPSSPAPASGRRNPPDAANDNDPATVPRPLTVDGDGHITARVRADDPDSEFAAPARSPLTGDDDDAFVMRTVGGDDDGEKTSPGRRRPVLEDDDDATPVPLTKEEQDALAQRQHKEIEEAEQRAKEEADRRKAEADAWKAREQAKPPRNWDETVAAFRTEGIAGLGMQRIHATVDLGSVPLGELPYIPPNSRFIAPDPTSFDAAMRNYQALMANNRNIEVLLVRNRNTGEYMVVQGDATSVRIPKGPYIVERHSHPRIISTNLEAVLIRSLPSGDDGDVGAVQREALSALQDLPPGTVISRNSKIDIEVYDVQGNITTHETSFGVIAQGNDVVVWIEFHHPVTGKTVFEAFGSIAEYHAYALREFKVDLSATSDSTVKSAGTSGRAAPRPAAVHGDAITAAQRADIHFVAGRMAMHDDFNAQVQGLREHGEIDPHLGRAATLEDAHTRIRQMGLVGEPDSMIRLYNIINDESIPLPVRSMISDITLAATQRHMVETGQLAAGEPLIMLFHGATGARARDMTENGISMARKPGGISDDFGEGLYFTQHLESARVYAHGRGGTRQGADGAVIPYILRGSDFGAVVNVRTGGPHRAAWEAFVSANTQLFAKLNIDPDFLRLPSTMEALITNKPLPFGTFDAEGRGKVFNAFLDSLGGPHARPDVIFGDLGGPLTSGVQFRGGVTDQAVVRTQRLADILNEQHVRRGSAASDAEESRSMGTIKLPDEDNATNGAKTLAPDPLQAPKATVAAHLDNGGEAILQGIIDSYPNSRMKTKLLETLANIPVEHRPAMLRALLADDSEAALFEATRPIRQAMREAGCNIAQIETMMARLAFIREVAGPRMRETMGHLQTLRDTGFDTITNPLLARYVVESPFLLHMAMTHPATLQRLFDKMLAGRSNNMPSSKRFEQLIRRSLRSPHFHAERMALAQSWPEKLATKRATQPQPDIVATGEILAKMLGHPPGDRVASGDAQYGPRLPDIHEANPPLDSVGPIVPGTRVIHPDKGEGTVREVVNGIAKVSFDGGKTVDGLESINLADGMLHRAVNTLTGEMQPVVPIRQGGDLTSALAEVDAIRTDQNLMPFDANKESTGTVAIARVGEQRFDGFNSGMENVDHPMTLADRQAMLSTMQKLGLLPAGTDLTSNQFLTHAEFSALYRAQQVLGELPPVVELFVDRETCAFCMNNLHIIAAHFGIKELRIYYHNQPAPVPTIIKAKR